MTIGMLDQLTIQLMRDEGIRQHPYRDSVGKMTIGIGRNLDDVGLSRDEACYLLKNDLDRTVTDVESQFPWIAALDDIRRAVLINMGFNMGVHGLSEFRTMLGLLEKGDYDGAANEMLESLWAKQVGPRAFRLSLQMRLGVWQ